MRGLMDYGEGVRQLNGFAVALTAVDVVERLRSTMPCAVVYEPGNGTRYELLFVPCRGVQLAGTEPALPDAFFLVDGEVRPSWTIVARLNGDTFAYPFDLSMGATIHASYVQEKTRGGDGDTVALTALLRAICGTEDPALLY